MLKREKRDMGHCKPSVTFSLSKLQDIKHSTLGVKNMFVNKCIFRIFIKSKEQVST